MANTKNEKYKQIQFKRRIWRRVNMAAALEESLRGGETVSNGTLIDTMISRCYPQIPFDPEAETCQQ